MEGDRGAFLWTSQGTRGSGMGRGVGCEVKDRGEEKTRESVASGTSGEGGYLVMHKP